MTNYELYLVPVRERKSNGQFLKGNIPKNKFMKGNVPFNKGKKWNDYLSVEIQDRCKKGLVFGRKRCRKVIGIDRNGKWCVFESGADAARRIQGCDASLIRRCCRSKNITRHNGIKWYFENDNSWIIELNKLK